MQMEGTRNLKIVWGSFLEHVREDQGRHIYNCLIVKIQIFFESEQLNYEILCLIRFQSIWFVFMSANVQYLIRRFLTFPRLAINRLFILPL